MYSLLLAIHVILLINVFIKNECDLHFKVVYTMNNVTSTPVMKPSMGFCWHSIGNLYNSDLCPFNIAGVEL